MDTVKELILHHGYTALYGLLALGIIGLPVPDEILMTFVGYLTSIGWFGYTTALIVSFAGTMTGMTVSYAIGYKVGKPFLWRYGKWVKLTPDRLGKAERWFHKYGMWAVSFGYFVPGARHFNCYLAGMSGVRFWKYIAYAGSGAIFWCTLFITLGHILGNSIDTVMPLIHKYMSVGVLAVVLVAGLAGIIIVRLRKRTIQ